MTGWRRSAAAGLLLLAVYVGLSFLNSPRGFLGTDTGGKVATMKVMTERGRFDPDLGYWAEEWDPEGTLHPLAYTSRTTSGKWVNVTTLPALWAGWQLYRVGGYRAALLVPMAGAVAAAFAGLALLRRLDVGDRHAWHGFWLLGLASPLTIYALDFWEHTLGVALMAWAVVAVADATVGRRRPLVAGAGAGLLFGVAATMRTEALVYFGAAGLVGVVAFGYLGRRSAPPLRARAERVISLGAAMLVAAAVVLVANDALERVVTGGSVRSNRAAGTAAALGAAPGERAQEALWTLVALEGSTGGIVLGAAFVGLLGFVAVRRDTVAALIGAVGGGVVVALRFVSGGLGFVPGAGPAWVTPVAATALLGGPRDRPDVAPKEPPRRWTLASGVAAIALLAVPIVLGSQFRGGAGPQWAGRYLLVSGFLLAVLGWAALERRPPVIRLVFALVAVAVAATGVAWLGVRSHDIDRTFAALESRPEGVLVSDVYFFAREGGATYGERRWLSLDPNRRSAAEDAARVLREAGVPTLASVQLEGEEPLVLPGFRVRSTADLRLFAGVDLEVTSWERTQ